MSDSGVPESDQIRAEDQIEVDPDQPDQIDAHGGKDGDDDTLSDNSKNGGNEKPLDVEVTVLEKGKQKTTKTKKKCDNERPRVVRVNRSRGGPDRIYSMRYPLPTQIMMVEKACQAEVIEEHPEGIISMDSGIP